MLKKVKSGSRQKLLPEIEQLYDKNLVNKLRHSHRNCGYLYIVTNPTLWPQFHKFGISEKDLLGRFNGYNDGQPFPIECLFLVICLDVRLVEARIKQTVEEMKITCGKREFVKYDLEKLKALILSHMVKDEDLSNELGTPIYRKIDNVISLQKRLGDVDVKALLLPLNVAREGEFLLVQKDNKDDYKDHNLINEKVKMDKLPESETGFAKKKKKKVLKTLPLKIVVPSLVTPSHSTIPRSVIPFEMPVSSTSRVPGVLYNPSGSWYSVKNGVRKSFAEKKWGTREAWEMAVKHKLG